MPNLKKFEYHFLCDMDYNLPSRGHLDCAKLRHSLQKSKATLETVTISVTFLARRDTPDELPRRIQKWEVKDIYVANGAWYEHSQLKIS